MPRIQSASIQAHSDRHLPLAASLAASYEFEQPRRQLFIREADRRGGCITPWNYPLTGCRR